MTTVTETAQACPSPLPQVKPMLASPPKAERPHQLQGTHAFDLKLDGLRAVAYVQSGVVRLVNRNGIDITHQFPEVEASFMELPDCILDGEIVARSGSFQDVALRGKQNQPLDVIHAMQTHPCIYVAFDHLYENSTDLRPLPFSQRRESLDRLSAQHPLTTSVVSMDPGYFEQVKALGMEGVIAKRLASSYRAGRFSDWIKFKAVRSITAIGIGYEKGSGAREHFGAMFLALIDDAGQPVEVGRVGTGFTQRDIAEVKAMLDAGVPVLCEIECLNVSKDGRLRFPVYKGLRSPELSLTDAKLSQLNEIPRM